MKQETKLSIYDQLLKMWPDAHCELDYKDPFGLLIATILSAQTTDVIVNKVTPELLTKYPDAKSLSSANITEVEEIIRSTGFYKNKARNIIKCSQDIFEKYNNNVPEDLNKLVSLAGVGRKTANVVLGNAFNINHGVVVDTHVKRCSNLIGLSLETKPDKVEKELMEIFPSSQWTMISHLLIFLGRRICIARKPQCSLCPVKNICDSSKVDF